MMHEMTKNHPKLTVSVVVPVYNEEDTIIPCLEALLSQAEPADEIIVVDNNSIDGTHALLEEYKHKIRIIDEPKTGVVFARTTGFNAAKGDIIGRIDADTRVTPHWVAELRRIFAHPGIAATTGAIHYYDLPRFFNLVDKHLRAFSAVNKEDAIFLHGSNMAIRKSAWQAVRAELCLRKGVHEDLDLAVHLQLQKQRIFYAPRLVVSISARRLNDTWPDMRDYAMSNMHTYEVHHLKRKRTTILVAFALIATYLPLRAIHRGYDPHRRRLSLRRMVFARPKARKSPLN